MNREDVIRMAREAGLHLPYWADDEDPEKDPPRWTMVSPLPLLLERFAALVAAHIRETELKPDWNNYRQGVADGAASEREEIAQFLESTNLSQLPDATALHYARLLKGFAEGIRARKENT